MKVFVPDIRTHDVGYGACCRVCVILCVFASTQVWTDVVAKGISCWCSGTLCARMGSCCIEWMYWKGAQPRGEVSIHKSLFQIECHSQPVVDEGAGRGSQMGYKGYSCIRGALI